MRIQTVNEASNRTQLSMKSWLAPCMLAVTTGLALDATAQTMNLDFEGFPESYSYHASMDSLYNQYPGIIFVGGAKIAYEMVVTAYAKGDRRALKPLLSADVMTRFAQGMDERDKRGEKVEFTFVGVDKADVVEASMTAGIARITVRFAAKVISVTRDAAGTVVDGDPAKLADLIDVWTFAREVASSDPNWRLVETRAVS